MDTDERSEEVISPYASDDVPPQRVDEEAEEDDEDNSRSSASTAAKPSFHILTTQQLEQWVTANNQIDVGSAGNVVWTVSSAKHGNGVRHLMHYHDLNTFWQSDGVLPHVIRIRLSQLTPVEALALYVNSAVDQSYSPRIIKVKAGTHEGDMTEVAKADIGAGQECGWVLMELGDRQEGNSSSSADDKHNEDAGTAEDNRNKRSATGSTAEDGNKTTTGEPEEDVQPFSYNNVAAVLGHHTLSTPPRPSSAAAARVLASSPFAEAIQTTADRWLWCTMIDICICENQFNGRDCHLRGICLTGPRYEELEKEQLEDGVGGDLGRGIAASVKSILSGSSQVAAQMGGSSNNRRMQQDWLLR